MEIYVQSCGVAQKHGYCWLDKNQKRTEEPDLVKQVRDLIESEAPSVVLARNSGQLLLLVTGLKASQRTDYRGRTIRNSVAWIADTTNATENEDTLRAIAAFTLRDLLEKEIDSAVHSGGEIGFKASFETIQKLPEIAEAKKVQLFLNKPLPKELTKLTPENKGKLADALEKYYLPPKQASDNQKVVPLVVVTGIQDEETLDKAGVWRGMSSLVTKDKEVNQQLRLWDEIINFFQWLFDGVRTTNQKTGISVAAIALIPILYFVFQIIPIQSPATIPSCSTITHESLIFYARQGEVVVGDESVIKVLYNPQEIKTLVLVDKDEKPFNAAEDKTNNDGKRELTYRRKFDINEIYPIRLQGTNATDKPICEQHIYINVRPEQG